MEPEGSLPCSQLLDSILSQLNPVRPVDPYLPKVHGIFPLGLPTKTL
jgi:hypothetical protein